MQYRVFAMVGKTAIKYSESYGSVVQLVRMLPCHGRGRGFESRPVRTNH